MKKKEYFKFFFEKNFPNILLKPIFISALKNIKREFLLNKLYDIYKFKKLIKNKDANNVLKYYIPNINLFLTIKVDQQLNFYDKLILNQ